MCLWLPAKEEEAQEETESALKGNWFAVLVAETAQCFRLQVRMKTTKGKTDKEMQRRKSLGERSGRAQRRLFSREMRGDVGEEAARASEGKKGGSSAD